MTAVPSRWVALGGVLVLVVCALVLGLRGNDAPARPGADIVRLQQAAGLAPCPTGLGPEFGDLTVGCLGGGPDVQVNAPPSGGPTVVNVWATWCEPCLREVPAFVNFADLAAGRVSVVGVLRADSPASALTYASTMGMRYPSLLDDDGQISGRFGPGTPVTLFVDGEGRIAYRYSGGELTLPQLRALTAEHLGITV